VVPALAGRAIDDNPRQLTEPAPRGRIAKERAILSLPRSRVGRRVFGHLAFWVLLPAAAGLPHDLVAQRAPARQVVHEPHVVRSDASPPATIAGLDARPHVPLEFSRAWLSKVEEVRRRRAELHAEGLLDGATPAELAAQGGALSGTLRIPVIPVHYADVPPPFAVSELHDRLFGEARGDTMTLAAYWDEVSGGLLRVEGQVMPWVRLPRPAAHYLRPADHGWARFGRIAEFRETVLSAVDPHIDFGRFDNDGPDGEPNSGDDDGHVDFVVFVYAAPCTGDGRAGAIWPHRGAMPPYETSSVTADGQRVRITDYLVLPAVEAGSCAPLHIGVLAHEMGHAFGLPDLYGYDGRSQGIGAWGLMGTGSHSARYSPAHLSAWEKEQLGWVEVRWLPADATHVTIPPVARDRVVYRWESGDERRYYLLENRQQIGSDRQLPGHGLLVWRVDPDQGELGSWNGADERTVLALVAADGRGDLNHGRRAAASDPFPGQSGRRAFVVGYDRPLRLSAIAEIGGVVSATVSTGHSLPALVAEPRSLRFHTVMGEEPQRSAVEVRRLGGAAGAWEVASRLPAWLRVSRAGDALILRADPTGLPAGEYADTVELAVPDDEGLATRVAIALRVADAGAAEVIATDLPWSWGLAVAGGRVLQAGFGWDALSLRPRARVIQLAIGERRPATLARIPADALYAPAHVGDSAVYVIARAQDRNYVYRIEADGRAALVAGRLGHAPAYGTATLRDGSLLVAEWTGTVTRVTADGDVEPWTDLGVNVYQIAIDSAGTLYGAGLSGDVLRLEASGAFSMIPTGFGQGGLVAIAATPCGELYAAERGGEGRIVRIDRLGGQHVVATVQNAEFYGLAVDDRFIYAADLGNRQLLRIPRAGPGRFIIARSADAPHGTAAAAPVIAAP
jgi:M6 family metalloprotease-like protein